MNFIYSSYLKDIDICDSIINYHENNENKFEGMSGNSSEGMCIVNKKNKDSIDCIFKKNTELWKEYNRLLQGVVEEYILKYPYCNKYAGWRILENTLIQHYEPGQGYHQWHTERYSDDNLISARHLVFLTYLNDVTDGGETEFFHQKLKVNPKKGLTIIFPADWTHTHRGITSLTQNKYIVTGWFNYKKI